MSGYNHFTVAEGMEVVLFRMGVGWLLVHSPRSRAIRLWKDGEYDEHLIPYRIFWALAARKLIQQQKHSLNEQYKKIRVYRIT